MIGVVPGLGKVMILQTWIDKVTVLRLSMSCNGCVYQGR